jgi:hypothetical protein
MHYVHQKLTGAFRYNVLAIPVAAGGSLSAPWAFVITADRLPGDGFQLNHHSRMPTS